MSYHSIFSNLQAHCNCILKYCLYIPLIPSAYIYIYIFVCSDICKIVVKCICYFIGILHFKVSRGLVVRVVDLRPRVGVSRLARICELALRRCASKRWVPCRHLDGM